MRFRPDLKAALLVAALLTPAADACAGEDQTSTSSGTAVDVAAGDGLETEWSLSTEDSIAMAEDDTFVAPEDQYKIGQTLLITSAGPTPSTLVVIRDKELTITNNTDVPQVLTFLNSEVDDQGGTTLGPIAPGEQIVYKPPFPISMAYSLDGDGVDGMLQVDTGDQSAP